MRCTLLTLLLCTTTVAIAAPSHDEDPAPRSSKAAARHKKHRSAADAKQHRDDGDGDAKPARDDTDKETRTDAKQRRTTGSKRATTNQRGGDSDGDAGSKRASSSKQRRVDPEADDTGSKQRRVDPDATASSARRDDPAGSKRRDAAERVARDDEAPDLDVHTDPAPHEATISVAATRPAPERHHNEFYFVVGAAHIETRAQSGGLQLDAMGIAALAGPMGPVQGNVETDPVNIVAGMIGFAPAFTHGYLAIETVFGLPQTEKLHATGDLANKSLAPTALGLVPTGIPPLGSELGEAMAVPPMLTAIFRLPALGPLRFYAGGGGSVLFITDAKVTNKVLTEVGTPKLDITPSYGLVGQVGVDIHLFDRFSARIDFKELWFTTATATISNIKVHTTIPLLDTVDVGTAKAEFTANPIVVQAGIGATF